jgi:isopentenyldiphosphate isomerase
MEKHIGDNENEIWDVYDKSRTLTGKKHIRSIPLEAGEYHLVVHICIYNSKGEILIQKRQPWKKGWPGMWDLSAAGSAVTGDDSRTAAIREVKEELGIDLELTNENVQFTIEFSCGFDDYWIIKRDIEIKELSLQYEEVEQAKWVSKEEFIEMINNGDAIPYTFIDRIFDCCK